MTKRSVALIVCVLAALLSATAISRAFAQDSISGLWQEVSTPEHVNSHTVFSQDGQAVHVASYWEYKGTSIVWDGEGSRTGNKVIYHLRSTLSYPGWDVISRHELTVSPDGRTMTGTWSDTKGNSGQLRFIKIK